MAVKKGEYMDNYKEIEITDKDGNKFYEITENLRETWQLVKLHNGVSMKVLNHKISLKEGNKK